MKNTEIETFLQSVAELIENNLFTSLKMKLEQTECEKRFL